MKLNKCISVTSRYTRSINLERDFWNNQDLLDSYIPTSRSIFTLERIANALNETQSPKAWALIGPYGSGKSAFGVYLSNIFKDKKSLGHKAAFKTLAKSGGTLARSVKSFVTKKGPLFPIAISGTPESLTKRIARAILEASRELAQKQRRKKPPTHAKDIENKLETNQPIHVEDVISWVDAHQALAVTNGYGGTIILIDELGKFLEYEARHRSTQDVFLLQALAEKTLSSDIPSLSLVVFLHQSIEQYVASYGKRLRDEWKKVQGRFESIPFLEKSEQVIKVIGAAIEQNINKRTSDRVQSEVQKNIDTLQNYGGLKHIYSGGDSIKLLTDCFPLHPVTTSLLPVLCQKVAQNERTLFTYLSSKEPRGFQDLISNLEIDDKTTPWIYPHDLYEYFIQNHPGLLSDQLTQRRWAEVHTAIERLGDADALESDILKTIGVLNIAGSHSGLKASKDLINAIYGQNKTKTSRAIKQLIDKSLITYRKFSGEFRVWQGSDIDIDAHLSEQRQNLSQMDIVDLLGDRNTIKPIVARKYSIETGTLRHFEVHFCETIEAYENLEADVCSVIFLIPKNDDERQRLTKITASEATSQRHIIAEVGNAELVKEAIIEVAAYLRFEQSNPRLASDPIASRELKDRIDIAMQQERSLLSRITQQPEDHRWTWCGTLLNISSKRELQEKLTWVLNEIYAKSPAIQNEIINRNKLSGAATSARRKLILAMLDNARERDLSIEKHPPEKSIYLSLFKATGIHSSVGDQWKFSRPETNVNGFLHVWDAIDETLKRSPSPVNISKIFETLYDPPYGVKNGPLPLLIIAYIQSNADEIALFEHGQFSPFLSYEVVERILKKPQDFTLQKFVSDTAHLNVLEIYDDLLENDLSRESDSENHQRTLMHSAKNLAKFMAQLPDYARHTQAVSREASAFRDLFYAAKSPYHLMFTQIPELLGFESLSLRTLRGSEIGQFRGKLQTIISELRSAHHNLITKKILPELCNAFGESENTKLDHLKTRLGSNRYRELGTYTIDTQGLKAFLGRLTDDHGDERFWIENIANFLARKPSDKWNDEDWETARFRLTELTAKIRDIEKLRALKPNQDKKASDDTQVILIRTVSEGRETTDTIAVLTDSRVKELEKTKKEIEKVLEKLGDDELSNAALAMILRKDQGQVTKRPTVRKQKVLKTKK